MMIVISAFHQMRPVGRFRHSSDSYTCQLSLRIRPHVHQRFCLQGRKLLRNTAEMPNRSGPKQFWQTEYDIVSAEIASTRNNPNIDYTGETAVPRNFTFQL